MPPSLLQLQKKMDAFIYLRATGKLLKDKENQYDEE